MAIEIREVIIKTEIKTSNSKEKSRMTNHSMDIIKRELLEDCRRMLFETSKRKTYNR